MVLGQGLLWQPSNLSLPLPVRQLHLYPHCCCCHFRAGYLEETSERVDCHIRGAVLHLHISLIPTHPNMEAAHPIHSSKVAGQFSWKRRFAGGSGSGEEAAVAELEGGQQRQETLPQVPLGWWMKGGRELRLKVKVTGDLESESDRRSWNHNNGENLLCHVGGDQPGDVTKVFMPLEKKHYKPIWLLQNTFNNI